MNPTFRPLRLWLLPLGWLVAATLGHAQSAGSISGSVSDANTAALLVGAKVAVTGTALETYTAPDGSFALSGIPPGERDLVVGYLGYESKTVKIAVAAGAVAVHHVTLGGEIVRLTAFTVEGAAGAQARALNVQRAASNISNVVSADSMGRLPDSNVAEALKRISSISLVNNQQTGEGETVAIRGLDSGLNVYTINGVRASTPNANNRSLSLDTMSADGLQGVTVSKTLTPAYDADAIGGTIDLRTPTGFDYGRRAYRVGAKVAFNEYTRKYSPSATLGVGDVLLDGRLGLYFGANHENKNTLGEETENSGDWELFNYYPTTTRLNIDPDSFQMQGIDLARWESKLERRGFSGSVDYKFGAATKIHLRFQSSDYDRTTSRALWDLRNRPEPLGFGTLVQVNLADATLAQPRVTGFSAANGSIYDYTPAQIVDQDRDGLITDRDRRNAANNGPARVTGGRGGTDGLYSLGGASGIWAPRGFFVNRTFRYEQIESRLANLDVGGSTRLGALKLDGNLAYSVGERNTPFSTSLGFTTADVAPFTQQGVTFSFADPKIPKWQLPPAALGAVYDNTLQNFNSAGGTQTFSENEMVLAQANARYDFTRGGLPFYLQGGAKYRRASRAIDSNDLVALTRRAVTLADAGFLVSRYDTGYLRDNYNFGPIADGETVRRAVLGADPRLFSASTAIPAINQVRSDRTGRETVAAGYLMAGLRRGPWEFIGGGRYEMTDVKNTVWRTGRVVPANPSAASRYDERTGTGGFADTTADYNNVTPSLHANYRHSERLVVRGALWTSIARPEYRYIEAGESYTYNAAGEITAITRGNPGLRPAESINFDLGFELYTKHAGLLSLNVFHKRIEKFILFNNGQNETVPGTVNNLPVTVTQPGNGSDATITGVEVSFNHQLRSLPSPFDGLGFVSNLTFQTSEAETGIPYRIGRKVDFINAPERLWNLAIYYEKYGWEARLAGTYNGKYIEDFRTYAVDKWVQPRTQFDFKISRRLGGRWRAYFEAANLTNEHIYWTTNGPKISFQKDYTEVGRTYTFGVSWSL
jgi:iron complex outermembrane receptor protein